MQQIENTVFSGFLQPMIKPLHICETCGAAIYECVNATVKEQMSTSKRYCEDCIMSHCDTETNRILFCKENVDLNILAAWIVKNKCEFTDLGDAVEQYIQEEHGIDYFHWLLEAN